MLEAILCAFFYLIKFVVQVFFFLSSDIIESLQSHSITIIIPSILSSLRLLEAQESLGTVCYLSSHFLVTNYQEIILDAPQ